VPQVPDDQLPSPLEPRCLPEHHVRGHSPLGEAAGAASHSVVPWGGAGELEGWVAAPPLPSRPAGCTVEQ
jgi:hypothetical protein